MSDRPIITGISLRKSDPNERGTQILANFDVSTNGIVLRCCSLILHQDNRVTMLPPSMNRAPERKLIMITDSQLRRSIVEAAIAAYRALGGLAVGENAEAA
ncbi:hypothetical protein RQ734_16490 [Roseomonas mucosa]|uniref:hypothetical protein n=1 Tax=Roseomonas mucosa TaxID=207340 RepID=UPI0028CE0B6D|nr:hypothetical protein [Roseomonas mucosa]MDT8277672.1 hypothetical protein [Roseomonas mucosa]